MVDKDLIERKLSLLEEYYNDLEEISNKLSWEKFSQDKGSILNFVID